MDYRKTLSSSPAAGMQLARIDPGFTGEHLSHRQALPVIQKRLQS